MPNRFIAELRPRDIGRVAIVYPVMEWIVVEVADTVVPNLALPSWPAIPVVVLAILGFPFALLLA